MKVLNLPGFMRDLRTAKNRRGITWEKVATRAGINTGTMHRLVAYYFPEDSNSGIQRSTSMALETFIMLANWMGKTDVKAWLVDEDDIEPTGN